VTVTKFNSARPYAALLNLVNVTELGSVPFFPVKLDGQTLV
jgi:hypothetical protein